MNFGFYIYYYFICWQAFFFGIINSKEDALMDILEVKEKVLVTMKAEGRPLTAGDVANITGIDRKLVDKAFTQLKKEERIESPIRCKWQPKE